MEEVTRKRIMRKLDELPDEQLYQVLDYIEFLELKYARASGRKPDAFQQFAERLEDQMRVRSLAPKAMKSTMKVMSTAGKMLDGVRNVGKDLVAPLEPTEAANGQDRGPSLATGPAEADEESASQGDGSGRGTGDADSKERDGA